MGGSWNRRKTDLAGILITLIPHHINSNPNNLIPNSNTNSNPI